jgi:4-alpha-glucanotransferase
MAIATLNTHDLPTFVGWMAGHDLQHKRSIGVDPGESDDERHRAREALKAAAGGDSLEGVVRFLAQTPTRLVSVSVEDILDVRDQINMPGTVAEYPNWRLRWPVSLEALHHEPRLKRIAEVLEESGRAARNAGS